jgi:hypothetical protein
LLTRGSIVNEAELAWAFAQAANPNPYLTAIERNDVYVAIGGGETFSAIRCLITAVVRARQALPRDLLMKFEKWLDAYVRNDDEPHVRKLIGLVKSRPVDAPSVPEARYRYLPLAARYGRGSRPCEGIDE